MATTRSDGKVWIPSNPAYPVPVSPPLLRPPPSTTLVTQPVNPAARSPPIGQFQCPQQPSKCPTGRSCYLPKPTTRYSTEPFELSSSFPFTIKVEKEMWSTSVIEIEKWQVCQGIQWWQSQACSLRLWRQKGKSKMQPKAPSKRTSVCEWKEGIDV